MELGRLEKINDLRTVWRHEALDFTRWLAQEENIAILNEELEMNIKVIQTEANVGRYNVDILAKDEDNEKTIIIENQLDKTDHDHLGKLIVYASGLDAEVSIWIVKDVREEHKQAVQWLNEHGDEHINIFLIQVELWRIGTSNIAPKFQVICMPNNWAKEVKKSVTSELSNARIIQLKFWEDFTDYCRNSNVSFSIQKALPQLWYTVRIGISDAKINLTYSVQNQIIACEFYIEDNKNIFYHLKNFQTEINNEISEKLTWHELKDNKLSKIRLEADLIVQEDGTNWKEAIIWLKENTELFKLVFLKYINKNNS